MRPQWAVIVLAEQRKQVEAERTKIEEAAKLRDTYSQRLQVIEQMLNGARPEEIVKWLRKPENVGYARRFNIDVPGIKVPSERLNASIEAEDFVGDLYSAFNRYLPDSQMQEAFRAGQVNEIWLRNHFKNATELPDIVGRIVPTSPQARNLADAAAKVIDRAFYFLGSLPETTLARHPLARQIYRSDMTQRMDIALATKRMRFHRAVPAAAPPRRALRRARARPWSRGPPSAPPRAARGGAARRPCRAPW